MVLRTEFTTATGQVTVTAAPGLEPGARGHDLGVRRPHVLLRRVEASRGHVEIATDFSPRMEYGLTVPHVATCPGGVEARGGSLPIDVQRPRVPTRRSRAKRETRRRRGALATGGPGLVPEHLLPPGAIAWIEEQFKQALNRGGKVWASSTVPHAGRNPAPAGFRRSRRTPRTQGGTFSWQRPTWSARRPAPAWGTAATR